MTSDFKVLMKTTFGSPFAIVAGVLTGQVIVSSTRGEPISMELVALVLSCWFAGSLIIGVAALSVLRHMDGGGHG